MKLLKANQLPRDPAESAAYWVMRLDRPNCGPADRKAFESWRSSDPKHAKAFAAAQRALTVIDRNLNHVELTQMSEQAYRSTKMSRQGLLSSAAAGVAAVCALFLITEFYWQPAVKPDIGQQMQVSGGMFETAVGERSTVTLQDDSTVTLNTNSLVEARFTEDSDVRRLILVRGQAHFDVQKDLRPFEVLAGDRRILALGTQFDVRIDDEHGVEVTLVEGRVSVDFITDLATASPAGTVTPALTLTPLRTELNAGEQMIARPHEQPTVVIADLEQVSSWRDGQLVFRDDPLSDVVKEINRYSLRQLFVNDDQRLEAIKISGVFEAGSTTSFVAALETVHPVKAQNVSHDRIALIWHESGRR